MKTIATKLFIVLTMTCQFASAEVGIVGPSENLSPDEAEITKIMAQRDEMSKSKIPLDDSVRFNGDSVNEALFIMEAINTDCSKSDLYALAVKRYKLDPDRAGGGEISKLCHDRLVELFPVAN